MGLAGAAGLGMVHGFFRKLTLFDAASVAVDQVAAALQAALIPTPAPADRA